MSNITLLIIDPQNDFMDIKTASLPIKGAKQDMQNLASFIQANQSKINDIYVTLDSHSKVQIFHAIFWQDQNGNQPKPFTTISYSDVKNKVYTPLNQNLYNHCLAYTKHLEENGKHSLTIWPYHCLIGSYGHCVEETLLKSLHSFEENKIKNIRYIFKGGNPLVEHYGALQAEYEIKGDFTTTLNKELLNVLLSSDLLIIAGQASSHCVLETIKQIVANTSKENLKKLCILEDCMSPVLAENVDFAKMVNDYFESLTEQNVLITSSVNLTKVLSSV